MCLFNYLGAKLAISRERGGKMQGMGAMPMLFPSSAYAILWLVLKIMGFPSKEVYDACRRTLVE